MRERRAFRSARYPGSVLDLAAAEVRVDRTDVHAMIEALAVRLEESLPRLAVVKRRRVGGFRSKQTEVERIEIVLDDERFELLQPAADFNARVTGRARNHAQARGTAGRAVDQRVGRRGGPRCRDREQARIALEGLVT